jgi:hypothetical protein
MLTYRLQNDSINLTVSAAVDSLEDVAPVVVSAPPFEMQFFQDLMARQYGSNSRFLKEKDTGLSFVMAMNALRRQGWPIQLIEGVAIADSEFSFKGDVIDSEAIALEDSLNGVIVGHSSSNEDLGAELTRTDAEPVKVEGELLSEQDWETIADVSNADAEAALKQWKKTAPEQFAEILDAGEADETSNRPQN